MCAVVSRLIDATRFDHDSARRASHENTAGWSKAGGGLPGSEAANPVRCVADFTDCCSLALLNI